MRIFLTFFLSIAILLAAGCENIAAQSARGRKSTKRSIESVKKEKDATNRAIRETGQQLQANRQLTSRQLDSLENFRRKTANIQAEITTITSQMADVDRQIAAVSDTLSQFEKRRLKLQQSYRKMMRRMQGDHNAESKLSFVLSATDFKQAWQRVRYVKQYSSWQASRAAELRQATATLAQKRQTLEQLRQARARQASKLATARRQLVIEQERQEILVAELKRHGADLAALLREKEARARQLDRELDRLIAAEQARIERERVEQERRERERRLAQKRQREQERRLASQSAQPARPQQSPSDAQAQSKARPSAPSPGKAPDAASSSPKSYAEADRKLSGSFAANKGRLLFPVSGSYRITRGFGRQKHPDMPHVTTENNGIDIEVSPGANARAVFAGKVASILQVPGYNYIVMVRHGDYLTVYSGLNKPVVRKDQEVTANQVLAPVMPGPDSNGRGVLHFELRNNSRKYNPLEWVR